MKTKTAYVVFGFLAFLGRAATDQTPCNTSLSEGLRDELFTASSVQDTNRGPSQAKMGNGGWVPASYGGTYKEEYLQLDFERMVEITNIRLWPTDIGWYTRTTRISYSDDGLVWKVYNSRLSDELFGEEFTRKSGDENIDISLDPTIQARFLVLNPTNSYGYPGIKLEVFGCNITDEATPSGGVKIDRTIESDVVWIPSQSPVIIDSPISVSPSATLTIQAGVSVVFTQPKAGLTIYGSLNTTGIAGLEVLFTSSHPVVATRNKWNGIQQAATGEIHLLHTTVKQAVVGIQGNGSHTTIDSCLIHSCEEGIKLSNGLDVRTADASDVDTDQAVLRDTLVTFNVIGLVVHGVKEKELFIAYRCVFANSSRGIYLQNWNNLAFTSVHTAFIAIESEISDNSDSGVFVSEGTNTALLLKGSEISRNRNYGVYVYSWYKYYTFQTINIANCIIADQSYGIYLQYINSNGASYFIQNNTFKGTNLYIQHSLPSSSNQASNVAIENNTFIEVQNVPLEISINSAHFYSIHSNVFKGTKCAIKLTRTSNSHGVNVSISNNTFQHVFGEYAILTDDENIRLSIINNVINNVTVQDVIHLKKGFIDMIGNNFTSTTLTRCTVRVENEYDPNNILYFNNNYWNSADIVEIKSRLCDFFLDSSKQRIVINSIYNTPEMTTLLDTSNSDNFVTTFDVNSNVYFVGGIITEDTEVDGSLLMYPIFVNRSIMIMENVTVTLVGVRIKFSESRGIANHGRLWIGEEGSTTSIVEASEASKLWNGIILYKQDLQIVNTKITGSKLLIDSRSDIHVELRNSTVYSTNSLLLNRALNGNAIVILTKSIIEVSQTLLEAKINKTDVFSVSVEDSYLKSGRSVITVSKVGSHRYLNEINMNIVRSNVSSDQTAVSISDCDSYLFSNVTDTNLKATSRVFDIRVYATDLILTNNTLRDHSVGMFIQLCTKPEEYRNASRNVTITGCKFSSASYGNDVQFDNWYNYPIDHEFSFIDNEFADLAIHRRNGIQISGQRNNIGYRSLTVKRNFFNRYANAINTMTFIDQLSLLKNTCKNGKTFVKADFRGRSFRTFIIANNSILNNTNNGVVHLLQPYSGNETVIMTRNMFVNNSGVIVLFTSPFILIRHNYFESNQSLYNLKVEQPNDQYKDTQVNASLNYWGTDDISAIERKVFDQDYDSTLLDIIVRPYLGSKNLSDIQDKDAPFISESGEVGGAVNGEVTLSLDGSPYRVIANIEIQTTDSLHVEAGVVMLFDPDLRVLAEGFLNASGTVDFPVTMAAFSNLPWTGLVISANSTSTLRNLIVNTTKEGVLISSSSTTISNLTSNFSSKSGIDISIRYLPKIDGHLVYEGLRASNNTHTGINIDITNTVTANVSFNLKGCEALGNDANGMSIKGNASVKLSNCQMIENSGYGVYIAQSRGGRSFIQASQISYNKNMALYIEYTKEFGLQSSFVHNHVRRNYWTLSSFMYFNYNYRSNELTNISIVNNVFANNTSDGIQILIRPSTSVNVQNNTFTGGRRAFYSELYNRASETVNISFTNNTFSKITEVDRAVFTINFRYSIGTLNFFSNTVVNNTVLDFIEINGQDYKIAPSVNIVNNTFKQNIVQKNLLNIRIFPKLSIVQNKFMNYGISCELLTPPFINTSYFVNATHNYWATNRIHEVVEKICGFDTNMERSFVYYMPYYIDEAKQHLETTSHDTFYIDGAFGGEITKNTILSDVVNHGDVDIQRSILIRAGSSLTVQEGMTFRFHRGRGIYAEGSLQLLGGEKLVNLSSKQDEMWHGVILNTQSGISLLEKSMIKSSQRGVKIMSNLTTIRQSTIHNSSTVCLTVNSDLDIMLDMQGSQMSYCKVTGVDKTGNGNLSLVNMSITDSKLGVKDYSKSGNVVHRSGAFRNIQSEAVSIKVTGSDSRGNITIQDCKITNSTVGIDVNIGNYYGADKIAIDGNVFTDITSKAIAVAFLPYTYDYNSNNARIVNIGNNAFYNTCGMSLVSSNFGNFTFHDNTIVNSSCHIIEKDVNFLSLDINNEVNTPNRAFDISSNLFHNVSCSFLTRISEENRNNYPINGSVQYNRFVDVKGKKGVLLLDTKNIRITDNVFDSPDSLFDVYIIKTGNETINASNNWWGKADVQYALSRIYDNRSNPDVLGVNIHPIQTEQFQDCSDVNNCSSNGECISKNRCRCYSGWKGQTCSDFDCDGVQGCYGNGVCIGSNQCQCYNGWSGELCISPSCSDVQDCNGNGICVRPNTCVCASRFTGNECNSCIEEHWGPNCQPCPYCKHGHCNLDTGTCVCSSSNWAGELCDKCNETFYGEYCLPLMTVLSILPGDGLDKGGNTVHVRGHNFPEPNGTTYACRFGNKIVDGTWIAWNHVTCTAPQHVEGVVIVEISSDGVSFTDNRLTYRFYASCPPGSCGTDLVPPHGYCLFGSCSCILPWSGDNCDIQLLAPVIKTPPAIQTVAEASSYTNKLSVIQGEEPVRWILLIHPDEMKIDVRTGLIEWDYAFAQTTPYTVKASASNIIGQDSVEWLIDVPISYTAEVNMITPNGNLTKPAQVRITGSVQFLNNSVPKIVPVDVVISNVKRDDLILPVLTNPLSPTTFEALYYPRPDDAGEFLVTAKHPALETIAGDVLSWRVQGIQVSPSTITWDGLIEGSSVVFQNISTIVNTGGLPIANITAKVDGLSDSYVRKHGATSRVDSFLDYFAGNGSQAFDLVVENARPLSGVIYVVFSSAMGLTTRLRVNINLYVKKPLLVINPPSLTEDINRGSQKIINVEVSNIGEISARNVEASLPNDQRFSLVAFSLTNDSDTDSAQKELIIPAQRKALLVLAVTVSSSDGLGEMSGRIAINTNLTTSYISYKFYITSKRVLTLNVTVTDEYTYYASDNPHVSGAKVMLTNPRRNYHQVYYTNNDTGTVQFDNIYEDRYTLYVEAEEHTYYSAVILASSDNTKLEAFLKRTAVKIDWSVTPTTVKDEYVIKLESTFETFVPMPVITIEPAKVNTIPFELEEEDTIEFTITNHGLVRADNIRFALPTHPYLTFHTTVDSIGDLEANSTIVVPIKTKLKPRVKRNFIANVVCGLAMLYDLLCGGLQTYSRDISLTREYPGRPPLPCGASGPVSTGRIDEYYPGGVRNTSSGPGGPPGGTKVDYTPTTPLSCDCLKSLIKTCLLSLNPVTGCTTSVTDVMTAYTDEKSDGDLILGTLNLISGLADSAFACVFGRMCSLCGDLYTAARCWTDIELKCDNSRRRRDIESDVAYNLVHTAKPLNNFLDIMKDILGDDNMANIDTIWYGTFKVAISDDSDHGTLLSTEEMSSILQTFNEDQNKLTLKKFLIRWNDTASSWNNGTLLELADTGRVIDVASMESKIDKYISDVKAAKLRNYSSIFDEFDNAYAAYQAAEQNEKKSGKGDSSVCAKVRIRIVQNLVLTRSAFNAKLEMENGENTDLEDIQVDIVIRRAYGPGTLDNDKFSIGSPTLVGITAVDGTGSLTQDMSGTAEWLIIPYSTAAPKEDTLYDIGGRLSYRVGSSEFSVPLLPDTLTVKSNPSLVVHYFHEKYVQGDDPLTEEVEPIIPFSLCVLVMNSGYGVANSLKLSSAQPEIIENEKGLLVSFKIIGARLGDNAIAPSLTVDFGDIESFQTKTAQWLLTSSLKGTFYNYSATFENINPLGDPQLSLLENLEYHELIHLVSMENKEDDLTDFLVNDIIDENGIPDRIYNSGNGSDTSRVNEANVTRIETRSFQRSRSRIYIVISLTVSVANISQWYYVRYENNITSPLSRDNQHILQASRHDDKLLLVNTNVWQTTHIKDTFLIHIFDKNDGVNSSEEGYSTQYDLFYGPNNMYAPRFNSSELHVSIPFDSKIGRTVVVVYAYDIDRDEVSFSMKDPDFKDFVISISGEVMLNRSIIVGDLYEFQITVKDDGIPTKFTDTTVFVTVSPTSSNMTSTTSLTTQSTTSSSISTSALPIFTNKTSTSKSTPHPTSTTTGVTSTDDPLSKSTSLTTNGTTPITSSSGPLSTSSSSASPAKTKSTSSSSSTLNTTISSLSTIIENNTTPLSTTRKTTETSSASRTSTETSATVSDKPRTTMSVQTSTKTDQDGTEERLSSWVIPTAIGAGVLVLVVLVIIVYIWLLRSERTGSSSL